MAGQVAQQAAASAQPPVEVDGQPVSYRPLVAVLLHKPAGLLTATQDSRQPTVMDLLPQRDRRRNPAPVGRLDKDTTGLLLITDDGQGAHGLISPKSGVDKRYRALLDGPVTEDDVKAFARGMALSDFTSLPALLEPGKDNIAWCTVHEGKFHQVKRMFAARGRTVLALHRESIGSLTLPEGLKPGEFCYLSMEAWNDIRRQAGMGPWTEK